jgi:hypothetical protein
VGILLKHSVPISEVRAVADPGENFLLISCLHNGNRFTLGAVYGPNGNNPDFYRDLGMVLTAIGNDKIIIGGDWNCVWSKASLNRNIDICNMTSVPNPGNSAEMRHQFELLNMSDPYRVLHPGRSDFTYSPRASNKKNRSRLDYFVVSDSVVPLVTNCSICPHLQNKLFDHKAVFLDFGKKKSKLSRPTLDSKILKDPDIDLIVNISVAETYITYSDLAGFDKQNLLRRLGTARANLREAGPDPSYRDYEGLSQEFLLHRSGLIAGIKAMLDDISTERLFDSVLTVDDGLFLETLINNIRNDVVGYQNFIEKTKKKSLIMLKDKIERLKKDFNANTDEIHELECKLNVRIDLHMRSELEKHHLFDILNNERISPVFLKLAKSNNAGAQMTDIRRDNGEAFERENDRKNYDTRNALRN